MFLITTWFDFIVSNCRCDHISWPMVFFAPEKLLDTGGVSHTLRAWVVQNAQQPKEGGSKKQYKMCKTSKSILQFRKETIWQMRYFETNCLHLFLFRLKVFEGKDICHLFLLPLHSVTLWRLRLPWKILRVPGLKIYMTVVINNDDTVKVMVIMMITLLRTIMVKKH